MQTLEFSVLGPLEVRSAAHTLELGGPKQRALLAILLLSANRVVSRERLVEELWPDYGTSAADKTLNVSIARLRTALSRSGSRDERLITRAPGYLLRVEPGELDLQEFERLVAAGRAALDDLPRRASLLHAAEALWRGRALADLEFEPFARLDVERLEELRLTVIEERIDAELALGRPGLVPEIEALVASHPLRERLRAQLMRALYANARQAEALAVYTDTRKLLLDELGIEPSEELRDLERMVLNQDPGLRPRRPAARDSPEAPVRDRPGGTRGRAASVGAIAIAVALAVVLIVGHGTTTHAWATVHTPAVAILDASSGKLLADVPGDQPGIIRFGEGSIWALQQAGVLLQINPHTLRLTRSIPLGDIGGGSDIAVGEGAVWVTEHSQALLRVDPRYGSVSRVTLPQGGLAQPGTPGGVATGAGSVWVAQGSSRLLRLDPATGHVQHHFDIPDANVVAFGDGAAWVSTTGDVGRVTKIDARTDTIAATAELGAGIPCLVVGGGSVWAADDGHLWKLSLADDVLDTMDAPNGCGGMAYGAGRLWLAAGALVTRIDPLTEHTTSYRTGHLLVGVGAADRLIAVSMLPSPTDLVAGIRGRVLHVSFASHWPDLTDPAVAAAPDDNGKSPLEQQLQFATCARLVTFPAGGSAGGRRLAPEVATALPTVSADGRTYTFHINRRYRFSPPSGAPVTAATFKYSIERALSPRLGPDAPALRLVPDILGLRAYRAGIAAHVAGIVTRHDTLAIRLEHPAPDFPERIAASYFCPVPIGTPLGDPSAGAGGLNQPIPSAGPYYLTGEIGGAIDVLRRNPTYHGPRPQHLDAVIYSAAHRLEDAAAGVISGRADYVEERGSPLAPDSPIARRFGRGDPARRRYVLTPLLATDELVFNTRNRLLASAAVRRAINLALDRPSLAAAFGDLTTDRYLPPQMPGSTGRHLYPIDGPAPRAARRLLAGRTGSVRLAVCNEPQCMRLGRTVRANLRRIGIRVGVTRYRGDISPVTRRPRSDITLARVLALYPEPVTFLRAALGDGAPRRRLTALSLLPRSRRLAAAAQLEQILLRTSPPAAAFGTPAIPEFFSARVRCRTTSAASFGADLGALCVGPR
jgi:DNA-binding SARP family transcriptional activator/ABC-type oligopeptide transport system substrate-binding subunit/streptogramin lyase